MASEVTTFQSSPTLAGGCNVTTNMHHGHGCNGVSILTHPCGRVQPAHCNPREHPHRDRHRHRHRHRGEQFQSSPTLAGGCNRATQCANVQDLKGSAGLAHLPSVSILTHPCGRVQPSTGDPILGKPTRNSVRSNPHPPLRAGATCPRTHHVCPMALGHRRVSILTHPCGREQCNPPMHPSRATVVHVVRPLPVSILTHPCGRVQRIQVEPAFAVSILTHPCGRVPVLARR